MNISLPESTINRACTIVLRERTTLLLHAIILLQAVSDDPVFNAIYLEPVCFNEMKLKQLLYMCSNCKMYRNFLIIKYLHMCTLCLGDSLLFITKFCNKNSVLFFTKL